jgi:hypothetical protein
MIFSFSVYLEQRGKNADNWGFGEILNFRALL